MKTKFLNITALLLLSIFFMSCGRQEETIVKSISSVAFEGVGASHAYSLVGSASDYGTAQDIVVVDSVILMLPVTIDKDVSVVLRDSILSLALGDKSISPRHAIESWLNRECAENTDSLGYAMKDATATINTADGFQLVQGFVVNLSSEILSYCVCVSMYQPGAANGDESKSYVNFRLGKEEFISLKDIFTKNGLEALPEVINSRAQENPRYADLVNIDSLPFNDNFFLSSEGEIVFSYQSMEVGPHVLGIVQVPFYPYELVRYMTPEAVILFNLQDLE